MRFFVVGKFSVFFRPQIIFNCQLIEDFPCEIKRRREKPTRGKLTVRPMVCWRTDGVSHVVIEVLLVVRLHQIYG